MTLEKAIRNRIIELSKTFMNNETHDPRISTLLHICEAFDIDLKEFFNSPIFKNVLDE